MPRWASLLFLLLLSSITVQGQLVRGQDPLRSFEARLEQAREREVPLLAPGRFAEVRKLYVEAEALLRQKGRAEAARVLLQRAQQELEQAQLAAEGNRERLQRTLTLREETLGLTESVKTRAEKAEELLRQAAAQYEAGDAAAAKRIADAAEQEYSRVAATYFSEGPFGELKKALDQVRNEAPEAVFRQALTEFAAFERELGQTRISPKVLKERLGKIWELLFPKFFTDPPTTLTIDGFTLYVESYEDRKWNFRYNVIVNAKGIAWVSFSCNPFRSPFLAGIAVVNKRFMVVEAVKNDLEEIILADAQKLDATMRLGSTFELPIPAYARSGLQIQRAIKDWIKFRPLGDIKVRFENLTIQPGIQPKSGMVLAGEASYLTTLPQPAPIALSLAGFRLLIDSLKIDPSGARAAGTLEFPPSIVDPGTGHPGRVNLGNFAITPGCAFRQELPTLSFGPWSIGNTEMLIQGTGVTADFDSTWVAPGLSASSPASQPSWRGAILAEGNTIPASGLLISNTAYLRAAYSFKQAEVTGPGLYGQFLQTASFDFTTLQPFGYGLKLSSGKVDLKDSALQSARFLNNAIIAPKNAARASVGSAAEAFSSVLNVDSSLEMFGDAKITTPLQWGEFTQHSPGLVFYEARDFNPGYFYLTGTNHTNFFPVDSTGQFSSFSNVAFDVRMLGLRGLTNFRPRRLAVITPDTPGSRPLVFLPDDKRALSWVNISFGGIHGEFLFYRTEPGTNTDLGPDYQPFYVGKIPFVSANREGPKYRLDIQFASSSVCGSDMSGTLQIPNPVSSALDFEDMAFTSTAQISGAKLPFNSPLVLSYWGLDMVKKSGAPSGGVLSVRTGQVFFTAAGIREQRHFEQPFYLVWGEMLASGALNRLVFDYSGIGQKFDGFPYVTSFIRLSDYVPGQPAFLKTAGTVHFDFFGAKYVNVNDIYDPTKPGDPYNNRRIDALSMDTDAGGLFKASDKKLTGHWSSDLGSMDYDFDYDKNAQDGFLGLGKMSFLWIDGLVNSSIVIKHDRMCFSVNETTRHDFKLGPVANFGSMSRITGCGCINNGQLERFNLSAELETQGNVNIVLRSASYGSVEWSLTPSVSTLQIAGDMYLNILVAGDVEVTGSARFTVDRANDFVDGEVDGKFSTAGTLGFSSVLGDGQLNWHLGLLGGQGYQSLQGRIALQVIAPIGGSSAEGGFYVGINAPKAEAWVLASAGGKFALNMAPLPARLTGVYGYAKMSESINLWIISGGIEAYVGLGGFVLTPQQVINLNARASGLPVGGLPFVIGNAGVHVWGEILGGLVSAGGWVNLQVIAPYPFSFQGTLGLEGCVVWVVCGSVDVTAGLNSSEGLFVQ